MRPAPRTTVLWMALGAVTFAACWSASRAHRRHAAVVSASRTGIATTADELFSLAFVPTLALTLGPAGRKALEDAPGDYTAATLDHGGRSYAVRVKLKGNRTFRRLRDKPAFRVKFDEDGFLGLHGLALNNMIDDPTGVHEILAYRVYRAAGVPAPRAAYARVTVDGEPYGVYLMVEPVDKQLLTDRLGAPPTALFEGEYGCDVFPADTPRIELKRGGDTARDQFAALAAQADGDGHALFQDAKSLADVPEVLSFLAVNTLIGDFDGYWHSHNYFLAHGPPGEKWRLLPWGNDRVFDDDLPIYGSQGRLARLCFADHDCRLAYAKRLLQLAAVLERLAPEDSVRQELELASALLDRDVKSTHSVVDREAARGAMLEFVQHRPAGIRSALSCLDGGREVDRDGDGYGCMDCNDHNRAIHPGAAETCDQVDDDCDGLIDDAPACPCQVVRVDGAEFHVCDLPMSWANAAAFCDAKGMTLARFDSAAQSTQVFTAAIALRQDRWWLGARQADDGSFRWVDGAPFAFTRWGRDEPDNHRCDQRCLVLDDGDDGHWALGHCELYFPFACRAGAAP